MLAEEYKKDLAKLKHEYAQKYGSVPLTDIDLLPDA